MVNDEQKGRTISSEAAEKERLLKHEEAAKALGKPIYDDMKVSEVYSYAFSLSELIMKRVDRRKHID